MAKIEQGWVSPPPVADTALTGASPVASDSTGRVGALAGRVGGPALAVTYLSLLVILPLAAIVSNAFSRRWSAFWAAVSQPEAVAALKLTLFCSLVWPPSTRWPAWSSPGSWCGTTSRGKRLVSAVIDLPFALPTIVAGLTLLTLYGPDSPFGINVADPIGGSCWPWPS